MRHLEGMNQDGALGIHRVAAILRVLAAHPAGLRFTDIARACALEKATAHRVLKALAQEEFVVRDPSSRCYQIGALVAELGRAAAPQFNVAEACRPTLVRLAQASADTAFMFVWRGYDAHCVAREQGGFFIQTPVVAVDSRQPLGVNAGGLAMLAAASEELAAEVLLAVADRLPAYGGLTRDVLARRIDDARRRGYASISEYAVAGVTAIGVALCNRHGSPVAGLAIASTTERMSEARQAELVPLLAGEAAVLAPVFAG